MTCSILFMAFSVTQFRIVPLTVMPEGGRRRMHVQLSAGRLTGNVSTMCVNRASPGTKGRHSPSVSHTAISDSH